VRIKQDKFLLIYTGIGAGRKLVSAQKLGRRTTFKSDGRSGVRLKIRPEIWLRCFGLPYSSRGLRPLVTKGLG
jgi:hypothetical protein